MHGRQDVTKTNNKNINRILKRFNEEQIMKQKVYDGITTTYYTMYFEKNKNICKNRYKKNKFKIIKIKSNYILLLI